MKNIFCYIFVFTASLQIIVKADSTYVSPSFYYSYGNYSNKTYSESFAFYNSIQLSKKFYLLNSYDHLIINQNEWNYLQQIFLAGISVDYFPIYLKFNYAHIKGDFDYKPFLYQYSDFNNLYNFDFIYFQNLYYFGISYTYQNQIGYKAETVNQITLRLEKIISPDLFISLKPNISLLTDGRKLYSASLKIHYLLSKNFFLKAGGFAGERAYYFDSDLLTIFNQDDTQKYQVWGQLEYKLFKNISLAASYQHTNFSSYNIDYYIAGIKSSFNL